MTRSPAGKLLLPILAILPILAVVGLAAAWVRWGYYGELHAIDHELGQIPGVTVDSIWGNEDISLEDIGATIRIGNKGTLTFVDLEEGDATHARNIGLASIGPWFINTCGTFGPPDHKNQWFGSAIELTPGNPFAKLFPVEIRSVRDAVAHYDELLAVISSWPRAPKHGTLPDGTEYSISRGEYASLDCLSDPPSSNP